MKSAIKRYPARLDSSIWGPLQILWRVTSYLVFALMFSVSSYAASFCVSTTAELQDALAIAASNGESNEIQVVNGLDLSNTPIVTEGGKLRIETGYTANCASRVADPSRISAPPPQEQEPSHTAGIGGTLDDTSAIQDIRIDTPEKKGAGQGLVEGSGSIAGTVTGGDGSPLAEIRVTLWHIGNDGQPVWVGSSVTDSAGGYSFDNLGTGDYRVGFSDPQNIHASQYYDDKPARGLGTDIEVTDGNATTGIDATLAPAASISGVVTNTAGEPLEGIRVTAYIKSDDGVLHYVGFTETAPDGSYTLYGLPASNDYVIRFLDNENGEYATEFHNNAATSSDAKKIALAAGDTVNIDAKLEYAGSISGMVTACADDPDLEIKAEAFRQEDGVWKWHRAAKVEDDGTYTITDLEGGVTYRVRIKDYSGTCATKFYDGASDVDEAQDVGVTTGMDTSGIDVQLDLAAHFTGTVTDTAGNPLQEIRVTAYRRDNQGEWSYVTFVMTDANGNYDLSGLPAGTYIVRFLDLSGTFVTKYHDDASNQSSATILQIAAGTTTPNIDAQLAYAGGISGTVTDTAGNPLAGISVLVFRWDDDTQQWVWANSGTTDASGNYDVGDLNTGTYRVGFKDKSSQTYALEYYDDVLDFNGAAGIIVTAGVITTGVNAQLASAGSISGRVTDSAGNPLSGIEVWAVRWNGESWFRHNLAITDDNGAYEIKLLAEGPYRVEFADHKLQLYVTEYYNGASGISDGADVQVTAGNTTPNIDAQLSRRSSIKGTVTDSSGNTLANIEVTAYSWNGTYWEGADSGVTGSDGWYNIEGLQPDVYRLGLQSPPGSGTCYAAWYHDNVRDFENATDIVLTSDTTVTIDAQLQRCRADVVADFGVSDGIWARMSDGTWVQLHTSSAVSMVTGDIDGDGIDELIVDFGPTDGIWARMSDGTWVQLHTSSAVSMVTGDLDGDGIDELIVDFGPTYGIWARMSDGTWVQLHTSSAVSMVIGNLD